MTWLGEAYRWVSQRLDSGRLSALALVANLVLLAVLVVIGRRERPVAPRTRHQS